MFQASVVIAFYNDIRLLQLILESLSSEHRINFEVIIADDGSEDVVVNMLKKLHTRYPFPLVHLWHQDDGFRKPKILNKAILRARSNVLVFLDGDCIPQRGFLERHLEFRCRPHCRAGRRVDLVYDYVSVLDLSRPQDIFRLNYLPLLFGAMLGKVERIEKLICWPFWTQKTRPLKLNSIIGCNFSIEKEILIKLNGFDSRAKFAWGAEDSDLERRLILAGIPIDSMLGRATVFHFDKNFDNRSSLSGVGLDLFNEVKKEGYLVTKFGLNQEDLG